MVLKYTPAGATVRIARPRIPDAEKMIRMPLDLGLRIAQPYLTPALRTEIQQEFAPYWGRREHPLLIANRLIDVICEKCLVDLPVEEGRRLMGRALHASFVQTPVTRVMVTAMRLASIEWILRGIPRNFAAGNNFGSFEMAELAPRHWRFTLDDFPAHPEVLQGFFEAGAQELQNDSQYQCTCISSHCYYFDITWRIGRIGGSL
jgi:uncharacterized protein (TIGR02265 family)